MLAMAPLAQARFGRLLDRRNSTECCPCPASDAINQGVRTVTVTLLAADPRTETVTVQQTVTPSGTTVTVTQTVQPRPEPQTVTAINGTPQPSQGPPADESRPSIVTRTIQPEGTPQEGPTTVIVNLQAPQQTVTITNGRSPERATPGSPSVVTVTVNPNPSRPDSPFQVSESPSRPNGGDTVVTSLDPSVTAPPQVQPAVNGIYQTLTKTVSGGGGDNIEITVVNIISGASTCKKKHSGKPCHAGNHSMPLSTGAPCPSAMQSTSIATAYNTVVVALGAGIPRNATSTRTAHLTGALNPVMTKGRKPRGPLSKRSW